MIFGLNEVEEKQAKDWIAQHLKSCPKGYVAHEFATYEETCTPSSTFSYEFIPTGVGDIIYVNCLLCKTKSPQIWDESIEP